MELSDVLTIVGLMFGPYFSGWFWGRWERHTADVLEEMTK